MKNIILLYLFCFLFSCVHKKIDNQYYGTSELRMRMINEYDLEILRCNNREEPLQYCNNLNCATINLYNKNKDFIKSQRAYMDVDMLSLYPSQCTLDTIDIKEIIVGVFQIEDGSYYFGWKEHDKKEVGLIPFNYSKIKDKRILERRGRKLPIYLTMDTLINNTIIVYLKNESKYALKTKFLNPSVVLRCGSVSKNIEISRVKYDKRYINSFDSVAIKFDVPTDEIRYYISILCDEPMLNYQITSSKYPIMLTQHKDNKEGTNIRLKYLFNNIK